MGGASTVEGGRHFRCEEQSEYNINTWMRAYEAYRVCNRLDGRNCIQKDMEVKTMVLICQPEKRQVSKLSWEDF